jgi:cell fate (sporulation/competence/biofilm development) regulator YlbF (YheA/YmcA/DUF963 family)
MGLNDKARDLASLIKNTAEFNELRQAKSYIDRNRSLRAEMDEYDRKQTAIFSGKYSGNAEAGMRELGRKFENMSKIPEVDRYLKAARAFNDVLAGVFKTINDSISDSLR